MTLVEERRLKDELEDGGEEGEIARLLRDVITRKVVKQTVMTTVYGVTRYGARLQVRSCIFTTTWLRAAKYAMLPRTATSKFPLRNV